MRVLTVITFAAILAQSAPAQWFDKQSISSTVLIEKWQDTSFVPFGTGFVLWNYKNTKYPIVVTAGHLLHRSELFVSANADSSFISVAKREHLDTVRFDKLNWVLEGSRLRAKITLSTSSKKASLIDTLNDVGIFLIDLPTWGVTEEGDTVRYAQFQSIPRSKIRLRSGVSLGDECYFVGFPFGLGVSGRLEPIIRSGSVAWLSPTTNVFLLDAFSFGGNSGSPVFIKIQLGREPGVIGWDDAFLVGMITGHLGEDSQNWGLAICTWIDSILSLIDRAGALEIIQ